MFMKTKISENKSRHSHILRNIAKQWTKKQLIDKTRKKTSNVK